MDLNAKIADWKNRLNQSTQDFQNQFGPLSKAALNWKPDAPVWSIAQNIDHLIKINSSYFPILEELEKGTLKLPFTARFNFISNFFGNFILKSISPESQKKIKTFPIWEPATNDISENILNEFALHQKELIHKIEASLFLLATNPIIASPANKNITYPLEKAFEIIVVHEQRHLQQALEILRLMKEKNMEIYKKETMKDPTSFDIQVNRNDFYNYKIKTHPAPTEKDLAEKQILVKVNQFAFTANNITYAVVGDLVGYWKFFPVSADWGIIPVWGFAEVIASKNEAIQVGARFYGYYPMGSHLVMQPVKVKPTGFMDGMTHRQTLPPIYNNYVDTEKDPAYSPEGEAIQSIFRPLFTTSFLLDDFFKDNQFFGAKNIILTSASSKTAIGTAFLLNQKNQKTDLNIIGLTSVTNIDFVKKLDYYDRVFSYDQVAQLSEKEPSAIIDFSGNEQIQQNLQDHLGENLKYNCLVGMVDWTNRGENAPSNGTFFFAPTQALKRNKDWGREGFQQRIGKAWMQFTHRLHDWITIKEVQGAEALSDLYLQMLKGGMDSSVGYVVKLS